MDIDIASELTRAQYNRAQHQTDYTKSTRYDFDIRLDMAADFTPFYQVTISRKGGEIIHQQMAFSTVDAEAIVSSWWSQLEARETSVEMWGKQ